MIRTTLAAAALLLASPAMASQVLPNLFARTYCDARELGISKTDAITMAIKASTISGDPVMVTYEGKRQRADILSASLATVRLCPES